MRLTVALLVVMAVVSVGEAGSAWSHNTQPGRRLCGWRLADKLNRVCKGVYNKPRAADKYLFYRTRRREGSDVDHFGSSKAPADGDSYIDSDGLQLDTFLLLQPTQSTPQPFLSREEASQVLSSRRRSKRALSAECCRKACSVSEMMGYCY